ncbi:MAG: SGNH/GDSL hydrolase family protein [Candidatus Auribacterota bacterium]|nr:SGNH/GDSL hydrolase family protein [Candidatus Auribacterota bacterium]
MKPLPPRPDLRLEFIGDSITCGYGNEAGGPEEGYSPRTENNYLSYSALTARALGAEYICLAAAGRGVHQNFDGSTSGTIPELYTRVLPGDPSLLWDFKELPPRVVIINFGTNDFSRRIPDKSAFVNSYRKLIATVRKNYPEADIFCVVGPMLNDEWPEGAKALTTIRSYLNEMIEELKGEGEEKIHYLEFVPQQQSEGIGADWHPGLRIHQRMADQLTEAISGMIRRSVNSNQ